MTAQQESTGKQLRKYQSSLMISGTGVILFGAWSIAKVILLIVYKPELITDALTEPIDAFFVVTLVVVLALTLVPNLLLRMYVGLSAHAVARGRKRGYAYIVIAWGMALLPVVSTVVRLVLLFQSGDLHADIVADDVIVSLVDVASTTALVEVAVSGMRIKKLQG